MAGIPVHTSSPINENAPTKFGSTTAAPTHTGQAPANVSATTTSLTSAASAQPGASAVPAPTSTAASVYTPPSPTRTTAIPDSSGPPPPQPGQVPAPYKSTPTSSVPPPPEVSSLPQTQPLPAIQAQTVSPTTYPPPLPASPRLWTPSYTYAQPPAGVTSTATDLSHPPGYVQDHRASFADRPQMPTNESHSPSPTRAGRGLGILDTAPVPNSEGESNSPIWDTAVSWAKEAGKKLSEVEGEVWKKINGDK